MANWTKLNYPELDVVVWVATEYDVLLGYWDGESWKETDGSTMYQSVLGWAEIDYDAIKRDWDRV